MGRGRFEWNKETEAAAQEHLWPSRTSAPSLVAAANVELRTSHSLRCTRSTPVSVVGREPESRLCCCGQQHLGIRAIQLGAILKDDPEGSPRSVEKTGFPCNHRVLLISCSEGAPVQQACTSPTDACYSSCGIRGPNTLEPCSKPHIYGLIQQLLRDW